VGKIKIRSHIGIELFKMAVSSAVEIRPIVSICMEENRDTTP